MTGARTISKRQRVMNAYGGRCFYCGCSLHIDGTVWQGAMNGDSEAHRTYCYLDHLHAQVLGGSHDEENLVPSCRTCNSSKGKRGLEEFRAYQHQFAPHVRAAAALRLTLSAAHSPFDANLREALAWHEAQITPFVFPGEAYLATQKAGTQA